MPKAMTPIEELIAKLRGHANFHYATAEERKDFIQAADTLARLSADHAAALADGAEMERDRDETCDRLALVKAERDTALARIAELEGGEQRGYARCQAEVVAWLREEADAARTARDAATYSVTRNFLDASSLVKSCAADAIERGEFKPGEG